MIFHLKLYIEDHSMEFSKEAEDTLREIHAGLCGAHQVRPKLHDQIQRLRYYWPTIIADSMQFAKKMQRKPNSW